MSMNEQRKSVLVKLWNCKRNYALNRRKIYPNTQQSISENNNNTRQGFWRQYMGRSVREI